MMLQVPLGSDHFQSALQDMLDLATALNRFESPRLYWVQFHFSGSSKPSSEQCQ